jgi:hypothetical protein
MAVFKYKAEASLIYTKIDIGLTWYILVFQDDHQIAAQLTIAARMPL